jgi:hypothetical protein
MEQDRHLVNVGDDPRDVRGGREAADLDPAVGVARELAGELVEIDSPVAVLADGDDLGR